VEAALSLFDVMTSEIETLRKTANFTTFLTKKTNNKMATTQKCTLNFQYAYNYHVSWGGGGKKK